MKNIFFKNRFILSIFFLVIFLLPAISVYATQSSSTSYTILDIIPGNGNQSNSTNFSVTGSLSQVPYGSWATNAVPLVPGTITSCGKISASGTYTLGSNIIGISGSCFIIQANNVTINGAGFSITAGSGNTNYAVIATSSGNGGNGYGTTTISNINFLNFGGGINASGNNNLIGAGGNGGNIMIASSTLGSITSAGGSGSNSGNGGAGGVVVVTGTNLNLSNNTYSAGTLNLSYSGILTTTNTTLSALVSFVINSTNLGSYNGGSFPIIPGTINSCGTIYFAGTYTLGGNVSGSCDIQHFGVVIAGAGNTLAGNVTANSYGVTLSNITVTGSVSTTGATPGALTVNNASNLTGTINVTGIINGDGSSSLGNTIINSGASVATSSVGFVVDVINNGTINSGNTVAGKTTNNTTINGKFVFNASSTNSGTVNGNAILNGSSTNSGTITGTARFNMFTVFGGAVTFSGTTAFGGIGYVNGNVYDSTGKQINSWIFNASTTNTGILKGNAVFNGTSSNAVSGTVQGNAVFNDTSRNLGIVTGNSDVYSPVVRPLGGTTNGQVLYHDYAGLYFNDSATGHGVSGKWDDILNWWTNAGATVHSPVVPTAGDNAIIVSGNITTSAITAVINTITFQGTSNNGIDIYISSTSTSGALFNASSTNSGTIHGNATFTGPDTDSSGTVTGYITRQYNAGTYVVVKDFTHNGVHWIIQSINGASVDLSGATYSLITNAFQALNNGIFSAWNNLIGGGASGTPVLSVSSPVVGTNIKWKPTVSWGTSNLCQYKIDGGNYVSVACGNNGSDIPRPTAGAHTIFFKSTDTKSDPANDVTEKSVSLTYDNTQPIDTDCSALLDEATRPYYYLTSNVGNCTITASTTLRGDDGLGHFFTVGNITGSSTNISLTNITATGTISKFNNITVASSTLSGAITVNGTLTSDTKSALGNTTIQSGGNITSGVFVGTLVNNGTITNSITTPVTVALGTTNNGIINGGFVFNGDSVNNGTINGDLSYGSLLAINGAVTFSINTAFPGTGIVSGNIEDYQGNIITRWIFNDDTSNAGLTKGDVFFNGLSANSGTVSGNAYFSDSSINAGTVTGNADVFYSVTTPITGVNGTITYHSYPNSPSFTNTAGDNDWDNISNWFTDTTFTTPLGRTPNTNENIVLFASTTLPSDIANNIFIAVSSSTLNGAGHTLNGNISGNGAYGGQNAYNFNLENITVTGTTTSNGGDGTPSIDGGKGGVIIVSTSSTGVITVNGGDPQHNGGDAGNAVINNSFAVVEGTPLLAIGGNSAGCGYGGAGGNISLIDSSGYVLIAATGADATTTIAQGGGCVNPPEGSHKSSGFITTKGVYGTPGVRNIVSVTQTIPKNNTTSSIARIIANLQSIFLPINTVGKLTLTTLPTFGGIAKNSFSFISPIENFLIKFFAPSVTTLGTAELNFPSLRTLLLKQGIVREQAVAALSVTPKRLLDTNSEGLFTVKGLTSKLTGDAKDIVYQKITTQPNKILVISLIPINDDPIVGTFNGKNISFRADNTITLTTPQNPGTYFLRTPSSPIPLAIVVSVSKDTSLAPQITPEIKAPTMWDSVVNWFKSAFSFFAK